MSGFFATLAGFAWLLGCLAPALAQTLELYTEEYPPITFSQNGGAAGLGVEVVEEILRRTGRHAPIQVAP